MVDKKEWFALFTAAIASGETTRDAEAKADAAWIIWQNRSGRIETGARLVRAGREAVARLGALHVVKTDPGCQARIDALTMALDAFQFEDKP